MAFKTFTSTTLSSSDMNTYLMKQAVIVCTSGTRPASPPTGMTVFETDTGKLRYYEGTIWTEWPGQIVATTTGANTVTSSGLTEVAATSSTAGLGLASISLSSTRAYRIEIIARASGTTSTAVVVRVRASTGTVTTGSTQILAGQLITSAAGGTGAFDVTLSAPWTPASTGTWNLAVTAASGVSGNASWGPGNANPIITLYGA